MMAHVLGRPYANILARFAHVNMQEEWVPATDSFGFGWTGDVKYHLGAEQIFWKKGLLWILRFARSQS